LATNCKLPSTGGAVFWFDVLEVKPGQHVPLQAQWTDSPGHFDPIPAACVKSLIVAPRGVVQLSADGAGMEVAPTAKDGALINVAAVVYGTSVMAHARVVAPAANPLAGVWRERPGPCRDLPGGADATRIEEFVIKSTTFSVTWQPFESYHDYTGEYRFDTATGTLSMTASGGAYLPPDAKLNGTARITPEGLLEVRGVDFGTPRSGTAHPAGCAVIFEK
jgi:hypothetical protein